MNQYRHGDLLIVQVNEIPTEAKPKEGKVLAYGEVTGHKHQMDIGDLFETIDGKLYLRLKKDGNLTHEEHNRIKLPKGDYQVIHQREYSSEAIKRVVD